MRHHKVWDGKLKKQISIPFTQEEEIARDSEESKILTEQPMNDWIQEMTQSDVEITREQEDLIDHLIDDHVQIVNPVIKARRDKKKEIRSRRPKC